MYWKPDPSLFPPHLRARIRRGAGVGVGQDYSPWLKTRDVPSRGTSSVVTGIRNCRPHHLLSELEATYFYLLERQSCVIDIREQWPILDLDRTLELCAQFDVRHRYRGMNPEPFTIDFLITELVGEEVRYRGASIKSAQDAVNPRIRRRLAVEYEWCRALDVPWVLVDTSQFSKVLLQNLRFIRAWFRNHYSPDSETTPLFSNEFLRIYRTNVPLGELIGTAASHLRLSEAVAQDLFRYCAWSNQLQISLKPVLALDRPLILRTQRNHD